MAENSRKRMMAKLAEGIPGVGFAYPTAPASKYAPEQLAPIAPLKSAPYSAPGPYGQRMYPGLSQAEVNRLLDKGRGVMSERAKAAQAAAATPEARQKFRHSPEGQNQWNVQDDFRNGPEGYQVVNVNRAGNMSRPTWSTVDPSTGKLMGDRASQQKWRNFYQKGEDAFTAAAPLTAAAGTAAGGATLLKQVAGQTFKSSIRPVAAAASSAAAAGASNYAADTRRSFIGSAVAGAHPPKPTAPKSPWPNWWTASTAPKPTTPSPTYRAPIGLNKEGMLLELRGRLEKSGASEKQRPSSTNKTKHAVLGLAGMALGGHVLGNVGAKAARAVAYNKEGAGAAVRSMLPKGVRDYVVNKGSNDMASGIINGVTGKSPSFGRQVAETWLSPETVANQHVGEAIGRSLSASRTNASGKAVTPSKGKVIRQLKKIRKAMAMNPDVQNAAVARNVIPGINRALDSGELMNRVAPESGLKRAVKGVGAILAGAPLAALDPAMLLHAGINKARVAAAHSGIGREFVKDQALQGLGAAAREVAEKGGLGFLAPKAPALGATKDIVFDYGISPMARDAAGISHAVARSAINNPGGAGRLVGAAAALNPSVASGARFAMSHPLAGRLRSAMRAAQPEVHVSSENLRRRLAEHKAKRGITAG